MASEFPSADEIEVVEILVQLSEIILRRDVSSPEFIAEWGFKRRRSIPRRRNHGRERRNGIVSPKIKAEATSPATPLSFSPSESDSKRKYRKRKSLHSHKEKRDELKEKINELTKRRDLMLTEIENVRIYYDTLKADNLVLKARKEELISTELKRETPDMKSSQSSRLDGQKDNNQGLHHPPLNQDPTLNVKMTTVRDVNSLGLPDLNEPFEESFAVDAFQPLDYSMVNGRDQSRAMASEARRNRIQICRAKNPIALYKQRW